MGSEQKKRGAQTLSEGFCRMPWGESFREGAMTQWSDACLAVLPVIAAHANRDGKAWPQYGRICALAQVSKTTVARAVEQLTAGEWITKFPKWSGKYCGNGYRLSFGSYIEGSREYIAMYHRLVTSGTWGAMSPAARRVYLIFRAFAWTGLNAVELGFESADYGRAISPDDETVEPIAVEVRGKWKEFHYRDIQFLPTRIYDPASFADLSGVNPRTFRAARAWLIDNGLLCPYAYDQDADGEYSIAGFIIPLLPGIRFPHVLKAVEKAKKESMARVQASPGAKRSFAAMLNRTTSGKSKPSAS